MNRDLSIGLVLQVMLLWGSLVGSAHAIPRYAAQYGQDCSLCHVNPTGGGLRTAYATQFLVPMEMAWRTPDEDALARIDPRLGENLTYGVDFRTLYLWSDHEDYVRNFFLMQSDVYLGLELGERLHVVLERGREDTREAYGIAYLVPWNGYVKVGRFAPDFGWKRADHTAFTRSELGLAPPTQSDVGVEVGIRPGDLTISVSTWNGSPGTTFDTDDRVAGGARLALRRRVGSIQATVGASARWLPTGDAERTTIGGFGALHLAGLTWIGEIDWDRFDPSGGSRVTGVVHSQELSLVLRRGLTALATYDFHDPDVDRATGARHRYGLGLSTFVTYYARAELLVRRHESDDEEDDPDRWESVVQMHFLY